MPEWRYQKIQNQKNQRRSPAGNDPLNYQLRRQLSWKWPVAEAILRFSICTGNKKPIIIDINLMGYDNFDKNISKRLEIYNKFADSVDVKEIIVLFFFF